MVFDKAEWRRQDYLKNKAKYAQWSKEAAERKKAARGPVRIGRPPSTVPLEERKRLRVQKARERLDRKKAEATSHIYIGSVCKRGHSPERYVATGQCVQCVRERQKAHLAKDSTKHKKACREWQSRNKDRIRELARLAYAKNPQKHRDKVLRQARENPGRANANVAKRTTAKLKRTPKWSDLEKIRSIYIEASRLRRETGVKYVVDHEIPLRGKLVSGLHVPENLRIIENVENIKKGNKFDVSI